MRENPNLLNIVLNKNITVIFNKILTCDKVRVDVAYRLFSTLEYIFENEKV